MKKLFVSTLMLIVTLFLASCGNNNASTSSSTISATSESQHETETSSTSDNVSGDKYPFATPIVPAELSPDADSFQVSLDGNIITLPALYTDFATLGWEFDNIDDGETLKPGFVMVGNAALKKGDAILSGVHFVNLSDKELPLSECYIYGFAFAYNAKGAVATSFVLPGGLHIGSTIDDIISAYGEPTEKNDSSSAKTKLTYQFGEKNNIRFEIDKNQPPFWNRISIYREDFSVS